ncbi:MAG: box helicase [Rhodospirillales bacterium]|nr:box helicase [Rhodospirillales bacterium]
MTNFIDLGLAEPLLRALSTEGYTTPTPIQAKAIPPVLAGRDLIGIAQTGTGKTAAFALPLLQRLAAANKRPAPKSMRALILTPTRELALQIADSLANYGRHLNLRHTVIFGGVGQEPQVRSVARGIDIVVATPGRLIDLMGQGHVNVQSVETFILDEADRMLDMGFIHDVRRVVAKLPKERHTLFFSATMAGDVGKLAEGLLKDPVRVEVAPQATTAEKVEQSVIFAEKDEKRRLLLKLFEDPKLERTIIFTRMKHGANRVAELLDKAGISAAAIHGNKSQSARVRALEDFRAGRIRALVATDIAARGIDVDGITHVINYELPNVAEQYVHRIGRTARAGAAGIAIAFCDREERTYLKDIEKLIRMKLTPEAIVIPGPSAAELAAPRETRPQQHQQRQGQQPRREDGGRPSNNQPRRRRRGGSGLNSGGAPANASRSQRV